MREVSQSHTTDSHNVTACRMAQDTIWFGNYACVNKLYYSIVQNATTDQKIPSFRPYHLVCQSVLNTNVNCFLANAPQDSRNRIAYLECPQASPACPSENISIKMSVEHWRNDTDGGKRKHSEKNLLHCHIVHHKYHMDWTGIETAFPRWDTGRLTA
jgi:hypothetical protein